MVWLDGQASHRHHGPRALDPRICIGAVFALAEAQIMLAAAQRRS
jgi:cytochrome P450